MWVWVCAASDEIVACFPRVWQRHFQFCVVVDTFVCWLLVDVSARRRTIALAFACVSGLPSPPQALSRLFASHTYSALWEGGQGSLASAVLRGWHSAVERDPFAPGAHFNYTLALLVRHNLVNLATSCALVDAVHFRNSAAVATLAAIGTPSALQVCVCVSV